MRKVEFTKEDDALLMKYIATYNPLLKGRLGMKLYERLVQNAERKWSFSSHHSVQSWRERYKNNQPRFDAQILEYQKKHGISANTFDSSSHSTLQSGVRKTIPVSPRSHTNIPGGSTAPVGDNGAKKRLREVDSEDTNLDSGVAKKMCREKVSVERSRPCDSPLHIRSPSAELRNEGKAQVEPPPLMCLEEPEEDEAAPVIGPDDYTGALSGSGDSDQEAENQSEGREVSAPTRLSGPFSPANIAEVKPSLAPRKSSSPCLVGAVHGELSPSRQQHDISRAPVVEVPGFVRESVGAHLQPSQEPTPPHTSDINSPCSPLQRRPLLTNGTSSRPEIASRHMSSISQKRKQIPPSQRKRIVVPKVDDIFGTPPQVRASPPPRTSRREAPRLAEGPFRSAYINANGQSRPMLPDRCPSGTEEEAEADGAYEEWPLRRGTRKSLVRPEGVDPSPSREREQPIVRAQPQCLPSNVLAPSAVPVDKSSLVAKTVSVIEPVVTHDLQGSTSQITQIKAVPLQVARMVTPAIAETSKNVRRPLQPIVISSQDKLLPNFKRRLSTLDSIQAKDPAPVTSHNRLLFPVASAHELPPPVPGPPSKRDSLGQYPTPAALNDPSVNDPFRVSQNREARRWTLADDSKTPWVNACREDLVRRASVQHIDLRALHSGKNVGTSLIRGTMSVGRSNTSESSSVAKKKGPRSPSRSSTPSNLTESNKELVLALGLEAVYSRMANNHKFHIDIVREVAARQRSLEDADLVLRNMREAAGREYARLLRQDEAVYSHVGCETGESEEEDEDDADKTGDGQPVRPSQALLGPNHLPTSLVPQGRARRLALKISTASPDSSSTHPHDYSPPTPTRARAFRRLERQGRVEEAKLREARHVRRDLRPNSAEASQEADEQRIIKYLLQLQEDDKDGVPPKKLRNTIGPERLGEWDKEDETQEDEGGAGPSVSPEEIRQSGFPLEREYAAKVTPSLACSALATLSVLDAEWTNSDDELLLDGDLTVHEELVRRKGLGSVKFRTAHLYSLLLDG